MLWCHGERLGTQLITCARTAWLHAVKHACFLSVSVTYFLYTRACVLSCVWMPVQAASAQQCRHRLLETVHLGLVCLGLHTAVHEHVLVHLLIPQDLILSKDLFVRRYCVWSMPYSEQKLSHEPT